MKFIENLTKDYQNIKMKITDEVTGVEYSLMDTIVNLIKRIDSLEKRISTLEHEAVGTSNEIYELYNTIEMLKINSEEV